MKILAIIFVFLSLSSFSVHAGMYKWVDENGVTHYSNVAPAQNQEVEEKSEIKGSSSDVQTSTDLDRVTNSYKLDNIEHDLNKLKKNKPRSSSSNKSNEMADYYQHRIKKEDAIVNSRYKDLSIVKRESYDDSRKHKEKVRYYEERYERAKLELERVKNEYRKAKYGQ